MEKKLTEQEEQEIANKIQARINELQKESFDIDLCRGKGVTADKGHDLGDRQREIEKELSQLKSKPPSPSPPSSPGEGSI